MLRTTVMCNNLFVTFRLFVNRLTDGEEIIREHLRSLRQREAALNALEKENAELHDKVNLLIQEKGAVTRELERTKVSLLVSWVFEQIKNTSQFSQLFVISCIILLWRIWVLVKADGSSATFLCPTHTLSSILSFSLCSRKSPGKIAL